MRLVVVSPFLDRQHGTELCISEQIERLARQDQWQIQLYSQRVKQLKVVRPLERSAAQTAGGIYWHKISEIRGPHLLRYSWWLIANQWRRRRDKRSGRLTVDLVYSPGINCMDADVIVVHALFHEFYAKVRSELRFRRLPLHAWPLILHRKLYYRLIIGLESKIYRDPRVQLIAVSSHMAESLKNHFGRTDVMVIPNATDTQRFSPDARTTRRTESRKRFGYSDEDFVLLFIGNDWKNKGLDALLKAMTSLGDLPCQLIVVGSDDQRVYKQLIQELGLSDQIRFEAPSPDVLIFYAAADLYISASLEDSFGLPILEAMACGLPVIASSYAGASELMQDGETGLILLNPQDPVEIGRGIRALFTDVAGRKKMGMAAADYAQANCSWENNTRRTKEFLEAVLRDRPKN